MGGWLHLENLSFLLVIYVVAVQFKQDEAATAIQYLPGFDDPLPFYMETGYIGVGEGQEVQLFYYFVKSERNPEEDPLLLWVSGGPGCSAFSAFAFEIGPVIFKLVEYNGSLPTWVLNPNSWSKVSSIIFVDLPVGAGYSYATSEATYQSSDSIVASQAAQFMRKWLTEHHEFQSNPLYICGDSYAGVPLPIVVQLITLDNEMGSKPRMDIKGYILGNPSTDDQFDVISRIPTAHGLALISDELYQSLETNCGIDYSILHPTNNTSCIKSLASFQECLAGLYMENILYPMCGLASPNPTEIVSDRNRRRFMSDRQQSSSLAITIPTFGCVTYPHLLSNYWADDKAVRKALHVRKNTVEKWSRCNYRPDYTKDVRSSFMYHVSLSNKSYRSLIYSGDHDLIVPSMGTQAWIQALNYSIVEDWRSWHVDGQVAGYTTTYSNGMTFATIKGAGHIAPEYKPNECSLMFKRWIDHEPL